MLPESWGIFHKFQKEVVTTKLHREADLLLEHLHINRQNPGWDSRRGKAQPGNLFLVALHSAFFTRCSPIMAGMYNQEVNLQPGFLLTYWWNNQFQRIKCHGFFLLVNKWLFSGWYQGPDLSICLLGHWLLKSPCLGVFQQELQSGPWVTFVSGETASWYQMKTPVLQPDSVGWSLPTTYPLVSDPGRGMMPKAAMLKRWCFLCNPYLFFLRGSYHTQSGLKLLPPQYQATDMQHYYTPLG